jgi:hypothetical protein
LVVATDRDAIDVERVVDDGDFARFSAHADGTARTIFSMGHWLPLCELPAAVRFAEGQDVEEEIEVDGHGIAS